MNRLKVAVIFGSRSTEHDVSIITAISSIIKPLELSGNYEVYPVYIDKQGKWYAGNELKDINLYTSGRIEGYLAKQKPLSIRFDGGLTLVSGGIRPKEIKIDVVFPATHGTHGEDGELMGLLDMANVPYVGCDMPSSAIAMDKALSKIIASSFNIPTSKYIWFYSEQYQSSPEDIISKLKELVYPLFVKPVHLGSSIAITRVNSQKELKNAIEVAAHYDNKVIVEEAVANLIEVTVPIIGNDQLIPALVEEPLLKGEDFFDFDTKYMGGGKKGKNAKQGAQGYSRLPADIPKELYVQAEETAKNVYRALGCSGIARIDLLIDSKAKKVYFNEVNPLPGSLYSHNWRQSGRTSIDLVSELVNLALKRYQAKRQYETVFDTNYLKQY